MTCKECGGDSRIVDKRPAGEDVYRRRQCVKCGHRWTTYESREYSISQIRTLRSVQDDFTVMKDAIEHAVKKIESAIVE